MKLETNREGKEREVKKEQVGEGGKVIILWPKGIPDRMKTARNNGRKGQSQNPGEL